MQITVKYFASVRERLGRSSETVVTRATSLQGLRDELMERGGPYAECLAPNKAVRMALNQEMCDESSALEEGAEVAFFPPVTGG